MLVVNLYENVFRNVIILYTFIEMKIKMLVWLEEQWHFSFEILTDNWQKVTQHQ